MTSSVIFSQKNYYFGHFSILLFFYADWFYCFFNAEAQSREDIFEVLEIFEHVLWRCRVRSRKQRERYAGSRCAEVAEACGKNIIWKLPRLNNNLYSSLKENLCGLCLKSKACEAFWLALAPSPKVSCYASVFSNNRWVSASLRWRIKQAASQHHPRLKCDFSKLCGNLSRKIWRARK